MPTDANEAAYRISGRFGEGFYIDPSGRRPPLKIMEATEITWTKEIAVEDVPLSGNQTGSKDGGEQPGTGQMTIQEIDGWWRSLMFEQLNANLAERRASRDRGERIARTFTLQVWEDDPEALGVLGVQLEGVRISTVSGGFSFGDTITNRTIPFRYERLRPLKNFERIGNQIDAATGLPAIRYSVNLGASPR